MFNLEKKKLSDINMQIVQSSLTDHFTRVHPYSI